MALEWEEEEEEAAGKMQHQLEAFREEASGRCIGAVPRTQLLQQTELALGSSLLFILREIGWSLTSARGFCASALQPGENPSTSWKAKDIGQRLLRDATCHPFLPLMPYFVLLSDQLRSS